MPTSQAISIGISVSIVALISLLATFTVWLWRRLERYRSFRSVGTGKVFVREPYRLHRKIFGRQSEQIDLQECLEQHGTALILGTAGIGKTTLGLTMANMVGNPECRQIWIECTDDTDLEAILDRLSLHLKVKYGDTELREAFEKSEGHDPIQWIDLASAFLRKGRYVFYFDDLYLVKDKIVISELLPRLCSWSSVVVLTREFMPELDLLKQKAPAFVRLDLTGLSNVDALQLLREAGLSAESEDELLQLVERVHGHPKALEICIGLMLDKQRGLSLTELSSGSLLTKKPFAPLEKMIRISDRRLSRR